MSAAPLAEHAVELAEVFYRHLFAMLPEARDHFASDMSEQHRRMSTALLDAVRFIDEPERLRPYLYRLGAYHARELGVLPEQYPYVGRALVQAARDLSPSWSSMTSSCWVLVYEWISTIMLTGAQSAYNPHQPY